MSPSLAMTSRSAGCWARRWRSVRSASTGSPERREAIACSTASREEPESGFPEDAAEVISQSPPDRIRPNTLRIGAADLPYPETLKGFAQGLHRDLSRLS